MVCGCKCGCTMLYILIAFIHLRLVLCARIGYVSCLFLFQPYPKEGKRTCCLWITISGFESLGGSQIKSITYVPRFFPKASKKPQSYQKSYQFARKHAGTSMYLGQPHA